MERIIKIFSIILLSLVTILPVNAAVASGQAAVNKFSSSDCIKTFPIGYEKLFYITLSALNDCNYSIKEIQTKGGYITFIVNNQKFLATIVYVSSAKSMLKISSYAGDYNFSSVIPQNIFKYVESCQNIPFN